MENNTLWERDLLAENYKNAAFMNGDIAAVHLESAEDEAFWNNMLQHHRPGHYHFIHRSKSKKGMDTSGRSVCLSFLGYLDENFFVCIDSDTDCIRKGHNSLAEKFVLQTYAYSWESIICHIPDLQDRFSEINKKPKRSFDFSEFLNKYSSVALKGLALAIDCEQKLDDNILKNVFSFFKKQCTAEEFENNGEGYIKKVSNQLNQYLAQKTDTVIKKNIKILSNRGITESNAYMYVIGHNLYDLIVYIGTRCCSSKDLSFVNNILNDDYPLDGYEEVDMIHRDIKTIIGS